MKRIPLLLIVLRPLLALLLLLLRNEGNFNLLVWVIVPLGLVSDIIDGIIARRLGISTPTLRRLDSAADQVFWLLLMATAWLKYPLFFRDHWLSLLLLLAAEAVIYSLSWIRFKKEVATHAIASKLWTLVLFATIMQLLLVGKSPVLYPICIWLGMITRAEIAAIILLLRQWTPDVPTVWHAVELRKGKRIKRNKYFNG
jgi:phosphatidylglycerophosphate synthase